jgi:hypothetical protein
MNTSEHRFGIVSIFVLGIAFALATFVLWPAEASTLPPRPTVEPTPAPTEPPADTPSGSSRVESSQIVLKVDVWELEAIDSWRALWTVVQWQDGLGRWHDVTGWRGHLDALDGVTGIKRWWVLEDEFGEGPFRWLVLSGPEGEVLAATEPFSLPSLPDSVVTVVASGVD